MATISRILASVRKRMIDHNVNAWIVPSSDPHNSEYVSDRYQRRAFVSGFTGSAGIAVITQHHALVWTDGRYFTQAQQQLQGDWQLMKDGVANVLKVPEWLAVTLVSGDRIGVDPYVTTTTLLRQLVDATKDKGIEVTLLDRNIVDDVWSEYGGPHSMMNDDDDDHRQPLFILPLQYSGVRVADKLRLIRERLKGKQLLVCALDEIAWLLNVRGADVQYNPVFYAYMIITDTAATVYVDEAKINDDVRQHLTDGGVDTRPYDHMVGDVAKIRDVPDARVSLDFGVCNMAIRAELPNDDKRVINEMSPISMAKALKNPVEYNGFRECHRRDAVAVIKYLVWLQLQLAAGTVITEVTGADYLQQLRSQQAHYVSLSFETISSVGANGAIIHYAPQAETCAQITTNEMYLCDSGGQYLDGTTDITRTVHFGEPTLHEIECFTRVLKGHIALARVRFPEGTTGPALDVFARSPLWQVGLDYGHGTGHGVGSFLNVHEGPHGISSTLRRSSVQTTPLQPMMTVTNEPGYYEVGKFGIRIENCMVVREADTPHHFRDRRFHEFETVTVVPIQAKLIDTKLLSADELQWLNDYHQLCWDSVSPLLLSGDADDDRTAVQWLRDATQPLA